MFKAIGHEILPVDAVWSWWSCIYEGFKDIFKETKQVFEGESPTLTHSVTFEEYILWPTADQRLANCCKVSYWRHCRVPVPCICMRRIGCEPPTATFFYRGSKHISLSLHPVEVMLLGNLNATRCHNQWHHCNYWSQLVFLPRCAIHTHSTTYTKFEDIINCRHKESKSEIEF